MMKRLTLLFVGCMLALTTSIAQERYLDVVFADTMVMSNVKYAENISILTGAPMKVDLHVDIYQPVGDTATNRPVVLMFGTGNFLPAVINGGPFGSKTDSAMVEVCGQFARRGYVAMGVEYRLGWNPVSSDDNVRRSTILQAAYRGIHDCRAAIRWLKKTVAEDGNPYGIDTANIVVGGMGTGGYISSGATFLNDYLEIASLPKFINLDNNQPYVIPQVHGNIYGTDTTFIPIDTMGTMAPFSLGNHTSYSSDFAAGFHLGGALGDSSWVNAGEGPFISVHSPQDFFAPYALGNVIVPTTGEIVIGDAAGGGLIQKRQDALGNSDLFYSRVFSDPISMARNTPLEGLYAFNAKPAPADTACIPGLPASAGTPDSGPWNWYDEATFIATWDFIDPNPPVTGSMANCLSLQGNLNDPAASKTFIDTVMQFLTPRLFAATITLNLEDELVARSLSIYPNPAQGVLNIEMESLGGTIQRVTMMDLTGRVVYAREEMRTSRETIDVSRLTPGLYLVEVRTADGRASKKVIIE